MAVSPGCKSTSRVLVPTVMSGLGTTASRRRGSSGFAKRAIWRPPTSAFPRTMKGMAPSRCAFSAEFSKRVVLVWPGWITAGVAVRPAGRSSRVTSMGASKSSSLSAVTVIGMRPPASTFGLRGRALSSKLGAGGRIVNR